MSPIMLLHSFSGCDYWGPKYCTFWLCTILILDGFITKGVRSVFAMNDWYILSCYNLLYKLLLEPTHMENSWTQLFTKLSTTKILWSMQQRDKAKNLPPHPMNLTVFSEKSPWSRGSSVDQHSSSTHIWSGWAEEQNKKKGNWFEIQALNIFTGDCQ